MAFPDPNNGISTPMQDRDQAREVMMIAIVLSSYFAMGLWLSSKLAWYLFRHSDDFFERLEKTMSPGIRTAFENQSHVIFPLMVVCEFFFWLPRELTELFQSKKTN
jgi:hypothetical protein